MRIGIDIDKKKKFYKKVIILCNLPVLLVVLFALVSFIINFNKEGMTTAFFGLVGICAIFSLFINIPFLGFKNMLKRHNQYTYVDIDKVYLTFSKYDPTELIALIVRRYLYMVELKKIVNCYIKGNKIIVEGDISKDHRNVQFDNSFKRIRKFVIPDVFPDLNEMNKLINDAIRKSKNNI